ncbi:MAG: hypothetical protein GXP62_17970 [Oligoflexia bacterium]|nr:hypothetical protein [Oligoflexia bacterium]
MLSTFSRSLLTTQRRLLSWQFDQAQATHKQMASLWTMSTDGARKAADQYLSMQDAMLQGGTLPGETLPGETLPGEEA